MLRKLQASAFFILPVAAYVIGQVLTSVPPAEDVSVVEPSSASRNVRKVNLAKRAPASVVKKRSMEKAESASPSFDNSPAEDLSQESSLPEESEKRIKTFGTNWGGKMASGKKSPAIQVPRRSSSGKNSEEAVDSGSSIKTTNSVFPDDAVVDSDESPNSEESADGVGGSAFSCASSVAGGTFGNPVQIQLDCTSAAIIKYCVQAGGGCCDPKTSGTTYGGNFTIGESDGNFCLSFYGDAVNSSQVSTVSDHSFTINLTYPDLQVAFTKSYYQTTQLAGVYALSSSDFGRTDFFAGSINLKSHDPGPMGLDLSCPQIIEDHATLTSPVPSVLLAAFGVQGLSSSDQLNVPFPLADLSYGENFITSYIADQRASVPIYSCSTNKLTLEDFDLFVPEVSHGEAEFAGGFVAYGFFEASADVNRGPAGQSVEDEGGQELRTGSFGIFY